MKKSKPKTKRKKVTKKRTTKRRRNPSDIASAYLWINKLIIYSDDDTFEPRQLGPEGSIIADKFNNKYAIKITKI